MHDRPQITEIDRAEQAKMPHVQPAKTSKYPWQFEIQGADEAAVNPTPDRASE